MEHQGLVGIQASQELLQAVLVGTQAYQGFPEHQAIAVIPAYQVTADIAEHQDGQVLADTAEVVLADSQVLVAFQDLVALVVGREQVAIQEIMVLLDQQDRQVQQDQLVHQGLVDLPDH